MRTMERGTEFQGMSPAGETDDLQFQKAEFAGRTCTACRAAIGDTYYQIQGRDACPTCAQLRLATQNATDSGGKMFKGFLWGSGAAFLGSAGYALLLFMNVQLSIVSIGIGWLVGTAIKKGTDGHTSRKYQVMAVLLTYLAIAFAFLPVMIVSLVKDHKPAAASSKNPRSARPPQANDDDATPKKAPAAGSLVLALIMAVGISIGLPLIVAFGSMPGGLLTLLIIFFGLQQAWVQTKPDDALVAGPYQNTP